MEIKMNAMILAAGLGTRLRPWTLEHPKALVPVGGVPMLERVARHLRGCGFGTIVVNVHHFAEQIEDFLRTHEVGNGVLISDESDQLLDTGGGILRAAEVVGRDVPLLVHNVDILSNANLAALAQAHVADANDITLLTSGRESSRKLMFDANGALQGWHDLKTDRYRMASGADKGALREDGFSGIYIVGPAAISALERYAAEKGVEAFPIMDFLLSFPAGLKVRRVYEPNLELIDIGKPETLARAQELCATIFPNRESESFS